MATISVPGAASTHLVFTVTGVSTTNYATAFAAAVNSAASSGSLTVNVVDSSGSTSIGAVVLNDLVTGSATHFTPITGQYTVIDETATVAGSTLGSDSVLAGSDTTTGPFSATYVASGSNNQITFVNGTNTYDGSRTGSGDTVTSGAGMDTINTGTGSTTVFSGSGSSLITLSDTVGADVVFLGDGVSTVIANGANDTIAARAAGQLIIGGVSGDNLSVAISAPTTMGAAGGGDTIITRGSATNVFDSVGDNTIYGGAGGLNFFGNSTLNVVSDTILAGSGSTNIFGFANADITFASTSTSGPIAVIAGTGNETLNGGNASDFAVFGDTTAAASSNSVFVGSSDTTSADFFSTGGGDQAYVSGAATDIFQLDTVSGGPAHITIFNFDLSGADKVGFGNDSANAQADLNSGTVTGGNLTLTLSDNTTVTFVGVTSLTGHTLT